jgi:hypothetical protein
MYLNGKMRPAETLPGMGWRQVKQEWWRHLLSLFHCFLLECRVFFCFILFCLDGTAVELRVLHYLSHAPAHFDLVIFHMGSLVFLPGQTGL